MSARKFKYENTKVRKIYKKSRVKERKRTALKGNETPLDLGEEKPVFFLPARYKLLAKL